jgi:hypothetical protein
VLEKQERNLAGLLYSIDSFVTGMFDPQRRAREAQKEDSERLRQERQLQVQQQQQLLLRRQKEAQAKAAMERARTAERERRRDMRASFSQEDGTSTGNVLTMNTGGTIAFVLSSDDDSEDIELP